jgi:hypothetical protein
MSSLALRTALATALLHIKPPGTDTARFVRRFSSQLLSGSSPSLPPILPIAGAPHCALEQPQSTDSCAQISFCPTVQSTLRSLDCPSSPPPDAVSAAAALCSILKQLRRSLQANGPFDFLPPPTLLISQVDLLCDTLNAVDPCASPELYHVFRRACFSAAAVLGSLHSSASPPTGPAFGPANLLGATAMRVLASAALLTPADLALALDDALAAEPCCPLGAAGASSLSAAPPAITPLSPASASLELPSFLARCYWAAFAERAVPLIAALLSGIAASDPPVSSRLPSPASCESQRCAGPARLPHPARQRVAGNITALTSRLARLRARASPFAAMCADEAAAAFITLARNSECGIPAAAAAKLATCGVWLL